MTNVYQVVDDALQCNGQAVTSGVEEMQVYFGEDTDANDVANRWMSPGTAGLNMERVVAVRVHVLAKTDGIVLVQRVLPKVLQGESVGVVLETG